jgi:L-lactate dehydrogenase complex protein LldF
MYVILLDNGRTELLRHHEQRSALWCIRCGACLNFCPVYKNIGGYTYNTTYSGPIGSVITPHLRGMDEYNHLSFASSLCGKCTEVCPVKINLHELLLLNRKESVKRGFTTKTERLAQYGAKRFLLSRKLMNFGSPSLKNRLMNFFFKNLWGPRRELPKLPPKNFNQLWEEWRGEKNQGK